MTENNALSLLRDFCGAGIAISAANTCALAADTVNDSIAKTFSTVAYQGVLYDVASAGGMALGGAMAGMFVVRAIKIGFDIN